MDLEQFKNAWGKFSKIKFVIAPGAGPNGKVYAVTLYNSYTQNKNTFYHGTLRIGAIRSATPYGRIEFNKKFLKEHPEFTNIVVIRSEQQSESEGFIFNDAALYEQEQENTLHKAQDPNATHDALANAHKSEVLDTNNEALKDNISASAASLPSSVEHLSNKVEIGKAFQSKLSPISNQKHIFEYAHSELLLPLINMLNSYEPGESKAVIEEGVRYGSWMFLSALLHEMPSGRALLNILGPKKLLRPFLTMVHYAMLDGLSRVDGIKDISFKRLTAYQEDFSRFTFKRLKSFIGAPGFPVSFASAKVKLLCDGNYPNIMSAGSALRLLALDGTSATFTRHAAPNETNNGHIAVVTQESGEQLGHMQYLGQQPDLKTFQGSFPQLEGLPIEQMILVSNRENSDEHDTLNALKEGHDFIYKVKASSEDIKQAFSHTMFKQHSGDVTLEAYEEIIDNFIEQILSPTSDFVQVETNLEPMVATMIKHEITLDNQEKKTVYSYLYSNLECLKEEMLDMVETYLSVNEHLYSSLEQGRNSTHYVFPAHITKLVSNKVFSLRADHSGFDLSEENLFDFILKSSSMVINTNLNLSIDQALAFFRSSERIEEISADAHIFARSYSATGGNDKTLVQTAFFIKMYASQLQSYISYCINQYNQNCPIGERIEIKDRYLMRMLAELDDNECATDGNNIIRPYHDLPPKHQRLFKACNLLPSTLQFKEGFFYPGNTINNQGQP